MMDQSNLVQVIASLRQWNDAERLAAETARLAEQCRLRFEDSMRDWQTTLGNQQEPSDE